MSDQVINRIPFPPSSFAYDLTLLKAQRNEVFRAVESLGLDPKRFKWEQVPSSEYQRPDVGVSKLVHSAGHFFLFNSTREGVLFYSMSPGRNGRIESGDTGSWVNQLAVAKGWLTLLKRELEETDLWETLKDEKALIEGAAGETDNRPFTPDEQRRVAESVEEIKQLLSNTPAMNSHQMAFVSDQLAYLVEASSRLGRKDWIMATVSSLVTITVALSLTPDSSRQLFRAAGQIFQWLIQERLYFPL